MSSSILGIKLNARLLPLHRARYERSLQQLLDARLPGSRISGGGTLINIDGEPVQCDLDVDLEGDPERGRTLVIEALERLGAPKGSTARLGDAEPVAFGVFEGLGLYLNGTDLPAEVYALSDVNELIAALADRLGDAGGMVSYWEGPRETALYFYGPSARQMYDRMRDVLDSFPLAQLCRIVALTPAPTRTD